VFLLGQAETLRYFLDSRLRGNDTLGLTRRGRGQLLHSAKMLHKNKGSDYSPVPEWNRLDMVKSIFGQPLRYFLDSRFCGKDTPQPALFCSGAVFSSGGRGEILHSAKVLPKILLLLSHSPSLTVPLGKTNLPLLVQRNPPSQQKQRHSHIPEVGPCVTI